MTELPQSETAPVPAYDERTAPYWRGLERGELALLRCTVCARLNHPAAEHCRVCQTSRLEWSVVPPEGVLFSWAVEVRSVIPGLLPPYVIAQVLPDACPDGGVRLVGTLLVEPDEQLELGLPVRLAPRRPAGSTVSLAYFVPDRRPARA